MMEKYKKFLIIGEIIAIIFVASFVGYRFWPAIFVGEEKITYSKYFNVRGGLLQSRDLGKEEISDFIIEAGVVMSFIEDALVKTELARRGIDDVKVREFLFGAVKRGDLDKLREATSKLYGWSVAEFEDYILMPQTRRIMLVRELKKENANADEWLMDAKKNADISIYLLRWKWQGELNSRY